MDWNWILLLTGALLILVEVALGGFAGFDLVLIGSAFMLGGALGLWFDNTRVGLLVSSALCLLYLADGRRWVRRRMTPTPLASNVDALVGTTGVVLQRVAGHEPGQVRVRDEVWRAVPVPGVSGPFEPGAVVTVAGVDGVTLHVR